MSSTLKMLGICLRKKRDPCLMTTPVTLTKQRDRENFTGTSASSPRHCFGDITWIKLSKVNIKKNIFGLIDGWMGGELEREEVDCWVLVLYLRCLIDALEERRILLKDNAFSLYPV